MIETKKYSVLLSVGHFCADINAGCLSALLPFLIAAYHYDYGTAAILVMVSNLVGSAVQLVFGELADRRDMPVMMLAGIGMSGGGMALVGVTDNFAVMCAAVIVSGTGIAMFHPQAMKLLNKVTVRGEEGNDVSVFSFGGNLGVSLGPVVVTACVKAFGLKGTLLLLIPPALSVLIFLSKGRALLRAGSFAEEESAETQKHVAETRLSSGGQDQWKAFWLLTVVVFGRSIIAGSLNTYMSLYWMEALGQSAATGNTILSVFYGLTALLTLLGGRLSDRYGYKRTIKWSLLILTPSLFWMASAHSTAVAALLLLPLSAGISISYSPIVVLGQKYLPGHTGFASGMTLGLSVSIGGIMTPLLGKVADASGISAALYVVAVLSVAPLIFSFLLKEIKKDE